MTKEQIALVQQSWAVLLPKAKESGLLFYDQLFAVAPGLRALFQADITSQANKLMTVLNFVVSQLHDLDQLLPKVQRLAIRHNAYGANPVHYEAVGQCLLATLQQALGRAWTPEVRSAWTTAYNTIKNIMIVAQNEGVSWTNKPVLNTTPASLEQFPK